MLEQLSGASRIHFIVGDPIAQVKSPFGLTAAFEQHGRNAVCVPAHVSTAQLATWFAGVSVAGNVDGIVVTIPHKFDAIGFCKTTSERARFLGAVNTLRRNPDGSWHGDMFDGLGYVTALQKNGCVLAGKKALLVGAGGAGSAIAHALVSAGVSQLAVHDEDTVRRDRLLERLRTMNTAQISAGSTSVAGFDVAVNATPAGMKAGDGFPFDVSSIRPSMHVGCVITAPAISPLIALARAAGCNTTTGADMFEQVREHMVSFLLGN